MLHKLHAMTEVSGALAWCGSNCHGMSDASGMVRGAIGHGINIDNQNLQAQTHRDKQMDQHGETKQLEEPAQTEEAQVNRSMGSRVMDFDMDQTQKFNMCIMGLVMVLGMDQTQWMRTRRRQASKQAASKQNIMDLVMDLGCQLGMD